MIRPATLVLLVCAATLPACRQPDTAETSAPPPQPEGAAASIPMGGSKSVTRFFVTSRGADAAALTSVTAADAHCQMLANAEGSGDHTWRAYLSAPAGEGQGAVAARDRIGSGPWYNAFGDMVAANVDELHNRAVFVSQELVLTEKAMPPEGEIRTSLTDVQAGGGSALFYCFAID